MKKICTFFLLITINLYSSQKEKSLSQLKDDIQHTKKKSQEALEDMQHEQAIEKQLKNFALELDTP